MAKPTLSRGEFLRRARLGAVALAAALPPLGTGTVGCRESGRRKGISVASDLARLSEHLWVYRGPIHVGIVRDGAKVLLIDCGDGRVAKVMSEGQTASVGLVNFPTFQNCLPERKWGGMVASHGCRHLWSICVR